MNGNGERGLPIRIELPEDFLQESVYGDHRVSADRKCIWAVELDLLAELQRVCEKHGLHYYANGGTLIGAVRHQGFIPWDDDIDVCMFRGDYDKLIALAQEEFREPYHFQAPVLEEEYFGDSAKLRNSLTTGITARWKAEKRRIDQGIAIDIFVLDGVPPRGSAANLKMPLMRMWARLLRNRVFPPELLHARGKALHALLTFWDKLTGGSFERSYARYEAALRRMSEKYTDRCMALEYLLLHWKADPPAEQQQWYAQTVMLPFEFMTVPAPAGYDGILSAWYGNYMQPVQAPSGHTGMFFDPFRPYTDYLQR